MKVLHLPFNIASQIAASVRGLRACGVEARGLAFSHLFQEAAGVESLGPADQRVRRLLPVALRLFRAIRWADVLHWHFSPALRGFDLRIATALRRRQVVEFWGSEIRNPDIESSCNEPYRQCYASGGWGYMSETAANSRRTQSLFGSHVSSVLVADGQLMSYLLPGLANKAVLVRQRLCLDALKPAFPSPTQVKVRIAHAPSAKAAKGTEALLGVLRELQGQFSFELDVISGVTRAAAIERLSQCDILLDQFVCGSIGLAALESMALGKPVVAHMTSVARATFPPECPLISATVDTLPSVLPRLLKDASLRHSLGRQGRAYVEQHHDANQVARDLIAVYEAAAA